MTVVKGNGGAEVAGSGGTVVPAALTSLVAGRETVGARVMVVGTAVTIPGFSGIQAAQMPVK